MRYRIIKSVKNIKYKITMIVLITVIIATLGCDGKNTSLEGTRLNVGESLTSGQNITSPNGYYALIMQQDGNLVLYHLPPNPSNAKWASCTQIRGGAKATLQNDGEFVVLDGNGNTVWGSGTKGYIGDYLLLQDDGSLVINAAVNNTVWRAGVMKGNNICNIVSGNVPGK